MPACCLQGNWIGFRSAAAEDRFLQLRRRGKQKLAFFSANFGVWEQWELVAGETKQPWSTQRMGLRSRQLQQVRCLHICCYNLQFLVVHVSMHDLAQYSCCIKVNRMTACHALCCDLPIAQMFSASRQGQSTGCKVTLCKHSSIAGGADS